MAAGSRQAGETAGGQAGGKAENPFAAGYQSYLEEQEIRREIRDVLEDPKLDRRGKRRRILMLKEDFFKRPGHPASLSAESHFDYVLRCLASPNRRIAAALLQAAVILAIFLASFYSSYRFYKRHVDIRPDDTALREAIEYYGKKDYLSSLHRLQILYRNGWDGYIVYEYTALCLAGNGNAGASARFLRRYIEEFYGVQNVTAEFPAYGRLQQLTPLLSGAYREAVDRFVLQIQGYADLYTKIEGELLEGEYARALEDCIDLRRRGADCFAFAALYTTALLENGYAREAYHYVMPFVRNDSSFQGKSTGAAERRALISYILPYMEELDASGKSADSGSTAHWEAAGLEEWDIGNRQDGQGVSYAQACREFLLYELDALSLHQGLQYAHDLYAQNDLDGTPWRAIYADDARSQLEAMGALREGDGFRISETPSLLYGQEIYVVTLSHAEGLSWDSTEYAYLPSKKQLIAMP